MSLYPLRIKMYKFFDKLPPCHNIRVTTTNITTCCSSSSCKRFFLENECLANFAVNVQIFLVIHFLPCPLINICFETSCIWLFVGSTLIWQQMHKIIWKYLFHLFCQIEREEEEQRSIQTQFYVKWHELRKHADCISRLLFGCKSNL